MNENTSQKIAISSQARPIVAAEESQLIALLTSIKHDAQKMRQTGQEVAKRYGKR